MMMLCVADDGRTLQAREHMEKAITTVLNFTPAEISAIQVREGGGRAFHVLSG